MVKGVVIPYDALTGLQRPVAAFAKDLIHSRAELHISSKQQDPSMESYAPLLPAISHTSYAYRRPCISVCPPEYCMFFRLEHHIRKNRSCRVGCWSLMRQRVWSGG